MNTVQAIHPKQGHLTLTLRSIFKTIAHENLGSALARAKLSRLHPPARSSSPEEKMPAASIEGALVGFVPLPWLYFSIL